jgi:anti-sigma factor ChrR (cupin superfamily)
MNCELIDYTHQYLLGLLEEPEVKRFERHLHQGCEQCSAEMNIMGKTLFEAANVESSAPSATTKARIMERVKELERHRKTQVWKEWRPSVTPAGLFTLRATDGMWEETDIEGISVKKLFSDPDKSTITMLVRMAAGTAYPQHRHGGTEECYVLEGDLHVGDSVLRSGDYQRAELDSIHVKQWTENGCLLLIVSSTEDEII